MRLEWLIDKEDKWAIQGVAVDGVAGECDICLPSKTLKDLLKVLDGYELKITEENQQAIITTSDSVIKVKGIDPQEWPAGIELA